MAALILKLFLLLVSLYMVEGLFTPGISTNHACHAVRREDVPKYCCITDQFEITYGQNIGQVLNGQATAFSEVSQIASDFKNEKFGSITEIYNMGAPTATVQSIVLVKESAVYTIMDQRCTKTPLPPGQKPNQCIPEGTKYINSYFIGQKTILINMWEQPLNGSEGQGLYGDFYEGVGDNTCIPYVTSFSGYAMQQEQKIPVMISGGYFNFTSGITNPKHWFTPPSFCPKEFTTKDHQDYGLNSFMERMRRWIPRWI